MGGDCLRLFFSKFTLAKLSKRKIVKRLRYEIANIFNFWHVVKRAQSQGLNKNFENTIFH